MAPERSRTLHNFSLPPRLNWGAQKLLRCANSNSNSASTSTSKLNDGGSDPNNRKRRNSSYRSPPPSIRRVPPPDDDQIDAIREKLMLDLRSEVDKMRAAILGTTTATQQNGAVSEVRPWNLRTRRAQTTSSPIVYPQTTPSEFTPTKLSPAPTADEAATPRAKFAVALTRQEIEDDFMEMMGRRPPRKPKKRPRYVQKQLDTLFPGLWLSEITADMYKVTENPEPAK